MEIANNESSETIDDETTDSRKFDLLRSGLEVLTALEGRVESGSDVQPQLEQVRSYLAKASREVGTAEFDRSFSKAMGMASSVAVANGDDELAEDALELGGDQQ
ncbi:hypothetical protein [Natronomonas moolapensis]|uniref:hypothetical protein n=1 Tax=Natronomonas moolapensis TaxID=416273 RepID=UPI00126011A0|nr:hypothetical protein [Natronomonas moolapensis]